MSGQQAIRQSELFAGEDWQVLYQAFNQINFNSYDPPSINAALRNYIQTQYPEDFNDWIESSEFVAIIDLLSWLAGSLAFRTDVNARENFLETAQSKESVLRLARFLSYNPRRAQSARGLVKMQQCKTTQSVLDSQGMDLQNRKIVYNDPDNPDWMEQFTLVLNSAMNATNPFGVPLKSAVMGGAATQLYSFNTLPQPSCVFPFNATVNGENDQFEIVNVDLMSDNGFSERAPNPQSSFCFLYRNDGRGLGSERSGFFFMFKQGQLRSELFDITAAVENRVLDLAATNISETDVWVQTLADTHDTLAPLQWEKVPGMLGYNITFNSIAPAVRNVFSAVTKPEDQVSLRFGDGRFGTAPVGLLKVWYRVVNGLQYNIRPADMERITINLPYWDAEGRQQTLTLTLALMERCSNALGSETIEQIRQRAPQVFGTQNRMVSGEDYNVFPLAGGQALKLRSVNRVYSGHSRYLDTFDPTATFQDTVQLSDDGILYQQLTTQYLQVPLSANLTPEQITNNRLKPMLEKLSLRDWVIDYFLNEPTLAAEFAFDEGKFVWQYNQGATSQYSTVGGVFTFLQDDHPDVQRLKRYLVNGCKLQFKWVDPVTQNAAWQWVDVQRINGATQLNEVIFSINGSLLSKGPNNAGASLVRIVPAFRNNLDHRPMTHLTPLNSSEGSLVQGFIALTLPFKLYYKFKVNSTLQYSSNVLAGQWVSQPYGQPQPPDSILVLTAQYMGGMFWSFEVVAGKQYVFESEKNIRWHNLSSHKVINGTTGSDRRDSITVLWSNRWAEGAQTPRSPVAFDIVDNVYDPDGFADYRKVIVTPADTDDDGSADQPASVGQLILSDDVTIYQLDYTTPFNSWVPVSMRVGTRVSPTLYANIDGKLNAGDVFYVKPLAGDATLGDFYRYSAAGVQPHLPLSAAERAPYVVVNGRNSLKFQWKHFSGTDVRIDPAPTNIIDIFVLTREYDFLVRQWISEGADPTTMPAPPSALDLKNTFAEFEQYKMFSDELVWRPVQYKYLFGPGSLPQLTAQFKIVRLPNPQLSDGEIRSKVIQAINNYFDVNKWEFGETFFFTELAAYIHIQLATSISSVAIVPTASDGKFGELFEVRCATNEVFISTAQVSDIVIIDSNSAANLRIK